MLLLLLLLLLLLIFAPFFPLLLLLLLMAMLLFLLLQQPCLLRCFQLLEILDVLVVLGAGADTVVSVVLLWPSLVVLALLVALL